MFRGRQLLNQIIGLKMKPTRAREWSRAHHLQAATHPRPKNEAATAWPIQAAEQVQHRRFAATRRAHDADVVAGLISSETPRSASTVTAPIW